MNPLLTQSPSPWRQFCFPNICSVQRPTFTPSSQGGPTRCFRNAVPPRRVCPPEHRQNGKVNPDEGEPRTDKPKERPHLCGTQNVTTKAGGRRSRSSGMSLNTTRPTLSSHGEGADKTLRGEQRSQVYNPATRANQVSRQNSRSTQQGTCREGPGCRRR